MARTDAWEERQAIYETAGDDAEAAHLAGVTIAQWHAWLKRARLRKKGLPPEANRVDLPPLEDAKRRQAYYDTPNDRDAARQLGMGVDAFRAWRDDARLEPRGPIDTAIDPGPSSECTDDENNLRLRAYQQEPSDNAAADYLGIIDYKFTTWRESMGLPRKQGRKNQFDYDPGREAELRRVYRIASSDADAAIRLGITVERFYAWRSRRGLPAKGESFRQKSISRANRYKAAYSGFEFDDEAAEAVGVSLDGWKRWLAKTGRYRKGCKAPERPALEQAYATDRDREILYFYLEGGTGKEALDSLGITNKRYKRWREERGLPETRTKRFREVVATDSALRKLAGLGANAQERMETGIAVLTPAWKAEFDSFGSFLRRSLSGNAEGMTAIFERLGQLSSPPPPEMDVPMAHWFDIVLQAWNYLRFRLELEDLPDNPILVKSPNYLDTGPAKPVRRELVAQGITSLGTWTVAIIIDPHGSRLQPMAKKWLDNHFRPLLDASSMAWFVVPSSNGDVHILLAQWGSGSPIGD